MVVKHNDMKTEARPNMRGGEGTVYLTDLGRDGSMPHCRLASVITLPKGASIGYHQHVGETEMFAVIQGCGTVNDDGREFAVEAGDSVFTADGHWHGIKNTGDIELKMVAVITTIA